MPGGGTTSGKVIDKKWSEKQHGRWEKNKKHITPNPRVLRHNRLKVPFTRVELVYKNEDVDSQ